MGNTPDSSAVSFDAEIYTDASGFRVPALHYQYPRDFESSILIIGDSVAFGPGVVEPETFPGILRTQNPRMRVYNAAVIGHSVRDYPNVLAVVLKSVSPSNVLLFLCLNDISSVSAGNLEETVNSNAPPHHRPDNYDEKLKNVNLVASFNVFLRDKSKLYLLLKGIVTDPSRRYFLSDYQNYLDRGTVEKQLQPLEAISILLKERNIAFTVVLVPYEFQLRNFRPRLDPVDITLPQRVIGEYLKAKGISFVDTYPDFQALASTQQSKYFLRFDPMHFSSLGHAEMFRILQARGLAAARKAKPG
jgi:lysophospholipase L1-like esterase